VTNEGAVWIDWNQDFDFDDDGELIAVEGSPGQGPYTATVTPPQDAVRGDTRMRIRLLWLDPIDPCGTTSFGEVEDYTITVVDTPIYCEASGGCSEHIARVEVGDIDNTSACDGYADYTDLCTEMAIGSEYDITVTVGDPYDDQDQGGMWVDWNRDGDFEDDAEMIAVEGSPGYGPYTATIIPPEGARLGAACLRIRVTWTGPVDACGDFPYGEVEDYTVIVAEGSSCPADLDGDGDVDTADLLYLLACWGTDCGDVDFDGDTDTADLLALLAAWGDCP
jgi:hypothetical protein